MLARVAATGSKRVDGHVGRGQMRPAASPLPVLLYELYFIDLLVFLNCIGHAVSYV